ncbi:MAG: hypothetical protein ACTSYA_07095 [Candidatus Kariarchaeaceae archaeon]
MVVIIHSIIDLIIIEALAYFVFIVAGIIHARGYPNWAVRKWIHVAGLTLWAYLAVQYSLFEVLIQVIVFAIILLILSAVPSIKFAFFYISIGKREDESSIEAFANPIITGATIFTILFLTSEMIFIAATLALAWGDGLGEIIGRPFGKHKYYIPFHPQKHTKSFEGSTSVFIGTVMGINVAFFAYGGSSVGLFLVSLITALIVTLFEAIYFPILSKLIDNVLVPSTVALGICIGKLYI